MKINLYGEIVSDEWAWLYQLFGIPCCFPKQVREAIAAMGPDEDLILEINSPGGDVWAGFEIFGLLRSCSAHTEAHIIAMAASAATTVSSGCDRVLASPVAQFMIHQPSAFVDGYLDNESTRQLKNFLDSVKASIINGYVVKSGGKTSRRKLEQLVDDSTWMPVQDAIELGLVDGILDTDEDLEAVLAAGGGVAVRNAAGISPAPKDLLERYEDAVRAGALEAVPGHPVSQERSENAEGGSPADSAAILHNDNLETVNNLIADWRLQAAIDLERVRNA